MKQINWNVTKEDALLIRDIGVRYLKLTKNVASLMDISMDLTACHLNGCPLDLQKLLKADNFNLAHDVVGISNHIDRQTGKLRDCFLPRCSK